MCKQNYRALAIRYRPRTFKDIIGHEAVKKAFTNAIQLNRIHHAFMLTGTRGVGKTTIARILALSLNCTSSDKPTIDPCLKCENCVQIINSSHPDIIEFDAASKTGVDSIREIINSTSYAPIMARYKVYIIDEVHMLSKGSFNALLKTVEEPMERIKFVFATTELRKVPITIISRCQKFVLGNMQQSELVTNLTDIAKKEEIDIEPEAIELIAKYANGSVRDSLSLLDQIIAVSENKIEATTVSASLAIPEFDSVVELFDAMLAQDVSLSLERSSKISVSTSDMEYVVSSILYIISVFVKAIAGNVKIEEPIIENIYNKHKDGLNLASLIRMWEVVSSSMKNISFVVSGQFLDMLCIKFIHTNQLPTPIEIVNSFVKE